MTKNILITLVVILTLVGAIGFFNDPVLGLFDVDLTHNLVHLLSGLLALYFAFKPEMAARNFARTFAVVYGLVTILGFLMPDTPVLGLMATNMADNWLHLLLALVFGYAGWG